MRDAVLVVEQRGICTLLRLATEYAGAPVVKISLPPRSLLYFDCKIADGIEEKEALDLLTQHLVEQDLAFKNARLQLTNLSRDEKLCAETAIYVTREKCGNQEWWQHTASSVEPRSSQS